LACIRCGREDEIEIHHIVARSEGGGDEPDNKEELCKACHDFEHTRRSIMAALATEKKRRDGGDINRIKVYEHRLEVLEKLNTPELIRERGTYLSYWTDDTTHFLPARGLTKKQFEDARQLELYKIGMMCKIILRPEDSRDPKRPWRTIWRCPECGQEMDGIYGYDDILIQKVLDHECPRVIKINGQWP